MAESVEAVLSNWRLQGVKEQFCGESDVQRFLEDLAGTRVVPEGASEDSVALWAANLYVESITPGPPSRRDCAAAKPPAPKKGKRRLGAAHGQQETTTEEGIKFSRTVNSPPSRAQLKRSVINSTEMHNWRAKSFPESVDVVVTVQTIVDASSAEGLRRATATIFDPDPASETMWENVGGPAQKLVEKRAAQTRHRLYLGALVLGAQGTVATLRSIVSETMISGATVAVPLYVLVSLAPTTCLDKLPAYKTAQVPPKYVQQATVSRVKCLPLVVW